MRGGGGKEQEREAESYVRQGINIGKICCYYGSGARREATDGGGGGFLRAPLLTITAGTAQASEAEDERERRATAATPVRHPSCRLMASTRLPITSAPPPGYIRACVGTGTAIYTQRRSWRSHPRESVRKRFRPSTVRSFLA